MLRILSFCLIILLVACQEKPKNYTPAVKKVESTKQTSTKTNTKTNTAAASKRTPDAVEATKRFPPISAPDEYQFKDGTSVRSTYERVLNLEPPPFSSDFRPTLE